MPAKPRVHARPAWQPPAASAVIEPQRDTERERALTLRYAEGDADAAVELAELLYRQGRTSTADKVLDFALRKGHPGAATLRALRGP